MKSPEFLHLLSLFLFGFNGVTAAYIHLSSDQIVILRLLIVNFQRFSTPYPEAA